MVRVRAVWHCLYFGLLPWWVYEEAKHHDLGYFKHLWINLCFAGRWLAWREDDEDRAFERAVNHNG